MELSIEQKNEIEKMEDILCKYFRIEKNDIISDIRAQKNSVARYFLWYILHYELGISFLAIGRLYFRTPRTIKLGCSKMRLRIKTHRHYKSIYAELSEELSDMIAEYKKLFV